LGPARGIGGTPKVKTVALDLDGVLNPNLTESLTEKPVPGAQQFVRRLMKEGYDVVIFTHRAVEPDGALETMEWLRKHDFPQLPVTAVKPACRAYIDDRCYRFEGDFDSAMAFIRDDEAVKPWTDKEER